MTRFGETRIPFFFDGTKCFFELQSITDDELSWLPTVTLTDGWTRTIRTLRLPPLTTSTCDN
jgi:hypothetical protein